MHRNWYAVCTKPGKEKKAIAALTKKGIENYCPLNYTTNLNNKNQRPAPLFSSCVFVYIDPSEIYTVSKTAYISNFLYFKSTPAIINTREIELVKQITSSFVNITLKKVAVDITQQVSVSDIPLFGYESNVMMINYGTLKINLPSLGFTLVAQKGAVKPAMAEQPTTGFRNLFATSLRSFLAIGL